MRIYIALLLSILLTSCQDSDTLKLSGTLAGVPDGTEVYLYEVGANNRGQITDTLLVKNERFVHQMPRPEMPEMRLLTIKGQNGNVIFFPEDKDVTFTLHKDSLYNSEVHGGKTNALHNEYKAQIATFNQRREQVAEAQREAQQNRDNEAYFKLQTEQVLIGDEEKVYRKEFAQKNTNSLLGLIVLNELMMRREVKAAEAADFIKKVPTHLQHTEYYKSLNTAIAASANSAEVGNPAPVFSGPTPDGDTLALQDALGKVTLIDFWASWCGPCRRENPNVVRVYEQYKDKGFNIISVSLDRPGQKKKWVKAIADDRMDWYHISNLQFWNDPIAKQYGVRSIPATFLLDADGNIIAKNLRGAALGQKVGELLD